jgi:hypothetical protein
MNRAPPRFSEGGGAFPHGIPPTAADNGPPPSILQLRRNVALPGRANGPPRVEHGAAVHQKVTGCRVSRHLYCLREDEMREAFISSDTSV